MVTATVYFQKAVRLKIACLEQRIEKRRAFLQSGIAEISLERLCREHDDQTRDYEELEFAQAMLKVNVGAGFFS